MVYLFFIFFLLTFWDELRLIYLVLRVTCYLLALASLLPYKLYWDYRREAPFSEEVITGFKYYIIACMIVGLVALYFGDWGLAKWFLGTACYFIILVYG